MIGKHINPICNLFCLSFRLFFSRKCQMFHLFLCPCCAFARRHFHSPPTHRGRRSERAGFGAVSCSAERQLHRGRLRVGPRPGGRSNLGFEAVGGWFNLNVPDVKRAYENHWFPLLNPCFCGGVCWGRLTSHDGMGGEIGWDGIFQSSMGGVFDFFFRSCWRIHSWKLFQLMVNSWFGARWFGIRIRRPLSNNQSLSFSGIQSESKPPNQTTN